VTDHVESKPQWADWTTLFWLLKAHPGEFDPESRMAPILKRAAPLWAERSELTAEEQERIRDVWVRGIYRPAIGLSTDRQNALRTLR
jgi:hypothetical protein